MQEAVKGLNTCTGEEKSIMEKNHLNENAKLVQDGADMNVS